MRNFIMNQSEEIIKIHTKTYWNIINDICNKTPEIEWYLVARDDLDEKFLGLKHTIPKELMTETPATFDPSLWSDAQTFKLFKIVNREKFLWIKMIYGI